MPYLVTFDHPDLKPDLVLDDLGAALLTVEGTLIEEYARTGARIEWTDTDPATLEEFQGY